jgi:ABC-type Fe3+-siderophore transport system permease subunit
MIAPTPRFPRLVTTTVVIRALGVVTAVLLAIDAYVHLRDAGLYDGGTGITEGALFRAEACVALVVALALLVRPLRVVWVIALLVAAGAAGAIYLFTYVDVGALGPLPNMYEPTWALPGKRLTAAAETAAMATAALGLAVTVRASRRTDRPVVGDSQARPATVDSAQPPTRREGTQ